MIGESLSSAHEATTRLIIFASVFALLALIEVLFPRRPLTQDKRRRWPMNIGLAALDTAILRFALPLLAVGTAEFAQAQQWGLLNRLDWPLWLELILAIIVLDILIYAAHIAWHHIPLLWAFHKLHHTDNDIDVSTALRFHPVEILLSMLFKMVCVLALGAPALAVLIFEILLNATAMFSHANIRLSPKIDKALRVFFVTPDMHRIHHSVIEAETNSNFGFCLAVWDRLFRTYRQNPAKGHDAMMIGLAAYQKAPTSNLIWAIILPFRR